MPELKDMDFRQMVDACTWEIVQALLRGNLSSGVHSALMLHGQWLKERQKQ